MALLPRGVRTPLLISALVLALLPASGKAQFTFITNGDNTLTITGYVGPGGVVVIPGEIDGLPVASIGGAAFYGCSNLTSVTIPDSVTSIGRLAFLGCSKLTSVSLGVGLAAIGDEAFEFCGSLVSATLPESVTSIGDEAFYACANLTGATIPNGVTNIGTSAFAGCSSLTIAVIPGNVTIIGRRAFDGCARLTEIKVDPLNPFYSSADGILLNKSQTMVIECPGGKAGWCVLPTGVIGIADWAFHACANLTGVTIPNGVTNIGNGTFSECSSLAALAIPGSVIAVGELAFNSCTRLTSIVIPSSVRVIWDMAFNGCAALTNVTLSSTAISIGQWGFRRCVDLTGVYFQGDAPVTDWFVFEDDGKTIIYYLPGTTGWGPTLAGRPTAAWVLPNPVILTTAPSFGVQTNGFGLRISWATNASVVVEASTDLAAQTWLPLQTNALNNGWVDFADPDWKNHPTRFYRVRSQ